MATKKRVNVEGGIPLPKDKEDIEADEYGFVPVSDNPVYTAIAIIFLSAVILAGLLFGYILIKG